MNVAQLRWTMLQVSASRRETLIKYYLLISEAASSGIRKPPDYCLKMVRVIEKDVLARKQL